MRSIVYQHRQWLPPMLLGVFVLACSLNFGPAAIERATLARDGAGVEPTIVFAQDDTFYCLVELAGASPDTRVRAAWTAVEVEGAEPNQAIDAAELTGDRFLQFKLSNNQPWPPGRYRVELYLNNNLNQTLEFQVERTGIAREVAEPSAPLAESGPTAIPEPTITPALTATVPGPEENSPAATPEPGVTPVVPTRAYNHPSGVFSFNVPDSWQKINEDATSAAFGDDRSGVGAVFTNAGAAYSEQQMLEFMASFADSFMKAFAADYDILQQEGQAGGRFYLAASYESSGGSGQADFFFEQRETVIFILYFVTPVYEENKPIWDRIVESYQADPAPVLAEVMPPTATAPAQDQAAPAASQSKLSVVNKYREPLTFTINETETTVPIRDEISLDLAAGKYTYTIGVSAGTVEGEVEMQPNQTWSILIDENGNVYYPEQVNP